MLRRSRRALLILSVVGVLAAALVAISASPAFAYGKANWQATLAATGTFPGFGGFGFWGWCDFACGVGSDASGDCGLPQYFHSTSGGAFTCRECLLLTSSAGTVGCVSGAVMVSRPA